MGDNAYMSFTQYDNGFPDNDNIEHPTTITVYCCANGHCSLAIFSTLIQIRLNLFSLSPKSKWGNYYKILHMSPFPNSNVHGANMGPIWGLQDPGGPHVGPINVAMWVGIGAPFTNTDWLITAWRSNYIHHKVWDDITYPFPYFNGSTVEVWK